MFWVGLTTRRTERLGLSLFVLGWINDPESGEVWVGLMTRRTERLRLCLFVLGWINDPENGEVRVEFIRFGLDY